MKAVFVFSLLSLHPVFLQSLIRSYQKINIYISIINYKLYLTPVLPVKIGKKVVFVRQQATMTKGKSEK